MFGHPGGDEAILSLDGVFVPDDHVLGAIGEGMTIAMSGVSSGGSTTRRGRWASPGGRCDAADYAQDRQAFGRAIIEYQAISYRLADAAMEVRAARLVGLDCARCLDRGDAARTELAIAKATPPRPRCG